MPSRHVVRIADLRRRCSRSPPAAAGAKPILPQIDNELLAQRRRSGADQRARGPDPRPIPTSPSRRSRTAPARPRRRSRRNIRPAGGRAAASARRRACGVPFQYGPEWAGRLPAEFPAYPGGRVTEAAGNDRGDCRMRVVTFTTADPHNRVLEYYRSLAVPRRLLGRASGARRRPGAGRQRAARAPII